MSAPKDDSDPQSARPSVSPKHNSSKHTPSRLPQTTGSSTRKASRKRAFRNLLGADLVTRSSLDLRILGRMFFHATLVGAAAGLVGSLFFAGLEFTQRFFLERIAGYVPLRASGELIAESDTAVSAPFRSWLLWLMPAVGALIGGVLTSQLAPETQGGGGDAIISAFHHKNGIVRRRVLGIKTLASIATLGFGGSGGREGPTMQIGGALGSLVGRYLRVDARERRVLLVAGVAAGMAAVFRTPLGAALLAVEVLYLDDFESDALIPAVLASVVSYSVFISFYGESTLFSHAPRYPFVPAHLPLYGIMTLGLALMSIIFLKALHAIKDLSARLPAPLWARPALGGLALGIFATAIISLMGPRVGMPGQGFGILGGGYGAAQIAITGTSWLPSGWRGAELLFLLGVIKLVATSLTIGTGGSAGDFGPSLVIGGLFGGAFGRGAQLLLHDPRIDPGAFALVGMGTFYGGIAHVPISSLVLVCELAGSYDLLVPLMLAEGIAFVALRKHSLYHAQMPTRRDSPAHRDEFIVSRALEGILVGDVVTKDKPYICFECGTPTREVMRKVAEMNWHDVFPVLAADGTMVGVIDADIVRTLAVERELEAFTVAADIMYKPFSVQVTDDLHQALEALLSHGMRELPVTDATGRLIGLLDEAEITRAYLNAKTTTT